MKYKTLITLLLPFIFCANTAYSQQGTVKGKVIDSENQTGLAGTEIADASGRVLTVSLDDGTFSFMLPEGKYILYINHTDFDQAVIETDVRTGETSDAGTIELRPSDLSKQDLFTININEGMEDGFETQSVQGILSANADVFLSNAAYTFGPVYFRIRGYDANYTNVSLNGFVMNDIESGSPYWSNWGGLWTMACKAMV